MNIVKRENNRELQEISSKKEVESIIRKFKAEIMRCVNCPILMQCSHPKKRLEGLREDAKKVSEDIYQEELELDDSADNTLRAQNKRDAVFKNYIEDRAYDVLKDERCIFEKQEILTILQKFSNAGYDLTEPRTSLIVNELLGNILNSGRSNKAFTSLGVILKKETPGGPVYYQNPLLKTKMEFSKLIIEATEALDRMLKSDETQAASRNFTDHLIKTMKLKQKSQAKIIDAEIIENEED